MTEPSFPFGGTAVAQRPDAVAAMAEDESVAGDNRRKLLLVVAAVAVLVVAVAAFFLLKSGGSSSGNAAGVVPSHAAAGGAAAPGAAAAAAPVTLPRKVAPPEGRNPFKALYVAPTAAPAAGAAAVTTTPPSAPATAPSANTGSTGTTKPGTQSYHPVWLMLKSITATTATFDIGYSNGKTLRTVRYFGVKAPKAGSQTMFASTFALLGISNGQALVKFGDGTPFRLDLTHNYMVVG